eukprot:Gb_31299 [translate_table: standard]
MDQQHKPEVLSSIPEIPIAADNHDKNGAGEVVLIIDPNRPTNKTTMTNVTKKDDGQRNGKEEEGGFDRSTKLAETMAEQQDEGLFALDFSNVRQRSRKPSRDDSAQEHGIPSSAVYKNLRRPGSSSFSMDSDAIEIDCDDRPRKTDVDAMWADLDKDNIPNHDHLDNKKSPQNQLGSKSPEEPKRTTNRVPTLSRSIFSKPKSRFVESYYPTSMNVLEENTPLMQERVTKSPNRATTPRGLNSTPRPPSTPRPTTPMATVEEEEEDPFKNEDLPEKYRKRKVSARLLLEWIAFVVLITCLISTLTVHPLEHRAVWGLELWKWLLMILVVFCGRLVSGWLISILVFLVERNFMLRKRVLYFVYGLRKSVQNCLWLGLAILAWSLLIDPTVERSTKNHKALVYVTKLLAAFLVAAVIWLFKILLVKVMASTFHVNTFFDRIQESILHQYVLETLAGPPVMETQQCLTDGRKFHESSDVKKSPDPRKTVVAGGQVSFRSVGVSQRKGGGKDEVSPNVIDVEKLHKMNQKNVSAWNMKRLVNVIRHSGISTISNTIDESMSMRDQNDAEITNEWQAKAAAKTIFKNVAKPDAKLGSILLYIEEEDLLRFMTKSEVDSVFPQFEGAIDSGKIKKSALKNWVVNVYIERKSLAHSLNDTKTAVDQLHRIATAVVIVIIIVVSLLVLGIATTHVIVLVSSQLLLVGFMFGNTCKTVFEAIVFVFIMHPFDVGDRCVIDGVQMIVEEMNILTTVFLRFDNEKVFYPNSALATKPISNFYRSPDMGDTVEFSVDVSTPMEKIGTLKERIAKYLENKPQHWHPKHSVVVKEIENMNKMRMALYTLHTMNHQNFGEKANRKSELVLEMKKICEDLGIKYHLLPQEVHVTFVGSATNQIPLQC